MAATSSACKLSALESERDALADAAAAESRRVAELEEEVSRLSLRVTSGEAERLREVKVQDGLSHRLENELAEARDALEICKLDLETALLEKEELEEMQQQADPPPPPPAVTKDDDEAPRLREALLRLRELGEAEAAKWREQLAAANAAASAGQVGVAWRAAHEAELMERREQSKDEASSSRVLEVLSARAMSLGEEKARLEREVTQLEDEVATCAELDEVQTAELAELSAIVESLQAELEAARRDARAAKDALLRSQRDAAAWRAQLDAERKQRVQEAPPSVKQPEPCSLLERRAALRDIESARSAALRSSMTTSKRDVAATVVAKAALLMRFGQLPAACLALVAGLNGLIFDAASDLEATEASLDAALLSDVKIPASQQQAASQQEQSWPLVDYAAALCLADAATLMSSPELQAQLVAPFGLRGGAEPLTPDDALTLCSLKQQGLAASPDLFESLVTALQGEDVDSAREALNKLRARAKKATDVDVDAEAQRLTRLVGALRRGEDAAWAHRGLVSAPSSKEEDAPLKKPVPEEVDEKKKAEEAAAAAEHEVLVSRLRSDARQQAQRWEATDAARRGAIAETAGLKDDLQRQQAAAADLTAQAASLQRALLDAKRLNSKGGNPEETVNKPCSPTQQRAARRRSPAPPIAAPNVTITRAALEALLPPLPTLVRKHDKSGGQADRETARRIADDLALLHREATAAHQADKQPSSASLHQKLAQLRLQAKPIILSTC